MHSIISKIIKIVKDRHLDILLTAMVTIITYTSFSLGRMNGLDKEKKAIVFHSPPLGYEKIPELGSKPLKANITSISNTPKEGAVYASKKSKNKYYYYEDCSGFKQLSPKNMITFISAEDAQKQGFQIANSCQ